MTKFISLLKNQAGVSALSTLAGFNICSYAGAGANEDDINKLEKYLNAKRAEMYFPIQTHSALVRRVPCPPEELREVDAVVTDKPGIIIGVHTADCLPLLMADPNAGVIAAVHCGWRGIVGGIVKNAVAEMLALGARPANISASFGPHICEQCFEVGEEVAMQFPKIAVKRAPGQKPRVSLADAVAIQLKALGINKIEHNRLCSKCDNRFYSVRRQGYSLGERTLSAIMLSHSSQ